MLCVIFLCLCCLLFTGCQAKELPKPEKMLDYQVEYAPYPAEVDNYMDPTYANGRVYGQAYDFNDDYNAMLLFSTDLQGKDYREDYTLVTEDPEASMQTIYWAESDANGTLWLLIDRTVEGRERLNMVHLAEDGNVLEELPLNLPQEARRFCRGADGWFYFLTEQRLYACDETLAIQYETDCVWEDMVSLTDGGVYGLTPQADGYLLQTVKNKNVETILPLERQLNDTVRVSYTRLVQGKAQASLCYYSVAGIYRYADGQAQELVHWQDYEINGDSVAAVFAEGEDFFVVSWDRELIYLHRLEEAVSNQRTELRLALCSETNTFLQNAVQDFNRENPTYHITMENYRQYTTEEDEMAGLTRLTTEILAGKGPDLLLTDGLPFYRYVEAGALVDLKPYIEQDPELDLSDFWAEPMALLEYKGGLYDAVPGVVLHTMTVEKGRYTEPNWNMDEFASFLQSMGEEETVPYYGRDNFLRAILSFCGGQFADWERGMTYFNQAAFQNLLRFAAQIQETDASERESPMTCVNARSYLGMKCEDAMLEGRSSYVGYPTVLGSGVVLTPYLSCAMLSSSPNKDGAWAFLRTLLLPDFMEHERDVYFPLHNEASAREAAEAMEPEYEPDENGNQVEVPKLCYTIPGEDGIGITYDIYAVAEEDIRWIDDMIENADCVLRADDTIETIVLEEAQAYFYGDKTLEEVCALIQNRADLYLAEQ